VAGYAHTRLGQHAEAVRCYNETVRLTPDLPLGWALLAESHRAAGEPQRGIATLERALLVRPDDPQLLYLLGEHYIALGRRQEAGDAARALQKTDRELAGKLLERVRSAP
jgi:predicted Zn-dependent protease